MGKRIYGLVGLLLLSTKAFAHGVVGDRFFPATLTIDDPFVADEMSLITIGTLKSPGTGNSPATRETDYSVDVSKRISRDWGINVGTTYKTFKGEDGSSAEGLDNVSSGLQYQFFKNEAHEAVSSLEFNWDMGGTGNKLIGDKFSTFTPAALFGKGFGDLPERLRYLKPLALTGSLGSAFPTQGINQNTGDAIPKVALWGFSVQYSLQYLQSNVKDVGLSEPFSRMIPLVEIPLQTPWNGDQKGQTTGTLNPGVIWFGRYIQLSLEAQVPINAASGKGVGAIGQIHLYLDDIAPKIFTWTPFSGVLGPTQPK
jgi:hypothetical protein